MPGILDPPPPCIGFGISWAERYQTPNQSDMAVWSSIICYQKYFSGTKCTEINFGQDCQCPTPTELAFGYPRGNIAV